MRPTLLAIVLSGALVTGCSRDIDPNDTNTDDTSDDTADDTGDTDTDTDTDSDTDTDTEIDTDVLDCQATYITPDPIGGAGDDACLTDTETLSCGDVIFGTTVGGTTLADSVYDGPSQGGHWECSPGSVGTLADWSAAERFYEFGLPAGGAATIRLDGSCGDLYLRTIQATEPCPLAYDINSCTVPFGSGSEQHIPLISPGNPRTFEIIIDGVDGFEGNYRLEVDCD